MTITQMIAFGFLTAACGTSSAPARDIAMSATYTVPANAEVYKCFRKNITEDTFITKFATSDAPGIHHAILGLADQSEPEGLTDCPLLLSVSTAWLFVAGHNAEEFSMPPDVAYEIPAGTQLVLQTHLLNPSDVELNTSETINLTGIAETDVVNRAQLVAAGSLNINLPPNAMTAISGHCTLPTDVQIFGVLAHMHSMGIGFKASLSTGESLYNHPFSGETQAFDSFAPLTWKQGTAFNVECDYYNSSDNKITYGELSTNEMCFGFAYYYPRIESQGLLCLN